MGGRTGKRAKPPQPCGRCGKEIPPGPFMRDGKADYHEECWHELRAAKKPAPPTPPDKTAEIDVDPDSPSDWEEV